MAAEKSTGDAVPPEQDLAAVIRQVGRGMTRLLQSGLNREAVVVLLADATGIGKKQIKAVLLGLAELEAQYTTPEAPR